MDDLKNAALVFKEMKKIDNQPFINTSTFFKSNSAINSSISEADYYSSINLLIQQGLLDEYMSGNNIVTAVTISEKGKHILISSISEIIKIIQK